MAKLMLHKVVDSHVDPDDHNDPCSRVFQSGCVS